MPVPAAADWPGDRRGRKGTVFPVSSLTLAAGYLWVSETVLAGSRDSSLLLYQVNPRTLTVIRSRQRLKREADYGSVGVAAGPGHTVRVGILGDCAAHRHQDGRHGAQDHAAGRRRPLAASR